MNPVELKEHLGGEFLANKLRATVDGKLVILARLEGESYVLTDEGHKAAAKINTTKPAEEKPKAKASTRKTTKAVVESQEDSE